jgi:ubiquinone/menaquinone biosynthesis C-methylase UbiE
MAQTQSYIPALSIDALTRYYDPALATIFQERRFRMPVVKALEVAPGQRILDLGCGTATLSLLIGANTAAGLIVGLDIDPVMLYTGQKKVAQSGALVSLTRGSADCLPYGNDSFDSAVSSLMLHHLETEQKRRMLCEAWRVLKPGGKVLVLDFGPVGSGNVARAAAAVFGRFERIDDNLSGRIPDFLREAGFADVQVADVAFQGVIKLFSGKK